MSKDMRAVMDSAQPLGRKFAKTAPSASLFILPAVAASPQLKTILIELNIIA